jgi:hypothetical protein
MNRASIRTGVPSDQSGGRSIAKDERFVDSYCTRSWSRTRRVDADQDDPSIRFADRRSHEVAGESPNYDTGRVERREIDLDLVGSIDFRGGSMPMTGGIPMRGSEANEAIVVTGHYLEYENSHGFDFTP